MNKMSYQKQMEIFQQMLPIFNVLNDENRQKIILLLAANETTGLSVTDITKELHLSRPAVSHHLKLLKQADVISYRKEGVEHLYYLTLKASVDLMKQLVEALEAQCDLI